MPTIDQTYVDAKVAVEANQSGHYSYLKRFTPKINELSKEDAKGHQ